MGLSGEHTQDARLVFQPFQPEQCTRTKFRNTSRDPYFGAVEKGVTLPKNNTVELANASSENSMRTI